MSCHVAFLRREPLQAITSLEKTHEVRLSRNRHPASSTRDGDHLLFKLSGGEIVARALAEEVHTFEDLVSAEIDTLRGWFATPGSFEDAYWTSRRNARHAIIIKLGELEYVSFPREFTPRGVFSGWVRDFEFGHLAKVCFQATV